MNMPMYMSVIFIWIVVFITLRNKSEAVVIKKVIEKRKNGGNICMKELAERFIGKECIVYSFDGHNLEGFIKEVASGAILIEKDGALEAVNLDFIIRIREYPLNKKGKKKSLVLD